ncbi:MAG: DUF1772 domain-containing protein [Actinomycetales bacterium]
MALGTILTAAAAVGSAIAGGVYANFSARVMPRLAELPDPQGISTMQQFNRTAVQAPFMTVFFGSAALSVAVITRVLRRPERAWFDWLAVGGSALYLMGFVVTIVYNVPRNDRLAAVDATSLPAIQVWHDYLREWTSANSVRAAMSLIGAAALGLSAVVLTRAD